MKHLFFALMIAITTVLPSYASKAYPKAVRVTQNDGSLLTLYGHGDEYFHWLSTADGALIVTSANGYYIAEVDKDGNLKATSQLAHEPSMRSESEKQLIAKQDLEKFQQHAQAMHLQATRSIGSSSLPYFAHVGTPKVLVILVEFPDCKMKARGEDAQLIFNHALNATLGTPAPEATANYYVNENYGSVKQYFYDISQGQFMPQFDVVGPVQVSKSYTYYGKDNSYSEGSDLNHRQLIKEACQLVSSNVNMQDYDQDGDGIADLVYVIYAGYGQNTTGNSADCLWPKCGITYDNTKYNGILVRRYGINNELNFTPSTSFTTYPDLPRLTGIGVFCHEFSHAMGLPDLYAVGNEACTDDMAMEDWDLMDGGEYCDEGNIPAPYSPWELDAMGWASPQKLGNTPQQVTLNPISQELDFYKIEGENNEYLLLQNIQKTGWWKGMPHHGLLIQRIDYPYNTVNADDSPNYSKSSPAVTIVPADGKLISSYSVQNNLATEEEYEASYLGDPFPGATERHELTSVQLNRSILTKPLYHINESEDGIITFDYLKDFATGIKSIIQEKKNKSIFTLDGQYLGKDITKEKSGIYIIGNKKVLVP